MPVLIWTTWSLCNGWSLQHCSQFKQNLLAVVDCKSSLESHLLRDERWEIDCLATHCGSSKRGKIWAMMIQDPWTSSSKGVRTKDWLQMELKKHSSWICWHENISTKDLWSAWIEMDIGLHIWFAFILHKKCQICFSLILHLKCEIWFSHILHKMCLMILSFFTRNAQSVLCFHIHAGFSKNSCTGSAAHRSARWESVLLCVSRLYTGEMFKGRRERQLQQVSDILRQKMEGKTATSSSCLFMLSLLNLHMLAGLYLQSP